MGRRTCFRPRECSFLTIMLCKRDVGKREREEDEEKSEKETLNYSCKLPYATTFLLIYLLDRSFSAEDIEINV